MPKISEQARLAALAVHARTGSIRKAAHAAGVSFGAAKRVITEARKAAGGDAQVSPRGDITREEGEREGRVEFTSERPVRTLADALKYADVDTTVWRVKRWECTGWQVGMKVREFDGGKVTAETPVARQLWRVKIVLERILPPPQREALDALFARLAAHAPAFARNQAVRPVVGRQAAPHLMVLDLVDTHFGKLAWAPETGQNYDLRIADRVYRDAVADLIDRASAYHVDEFLLPLGSDFLHIDNGGGTTTSGTPQDVDGRLAKILTVAEEAVLWAVAELAARGRVVVRWVPGNHDRLLSYCLARTVKAFFRQHPGVVVDVAPTARKYHRYGSTLIGLTHGDQEKHAALPAIMATEAAADWAATTCREWHTGHFHKSKVTAFLPLDTHNGVPVRTLRSLSAVDAWHYRSGYVGTQRSAEAFVYHRESGFVGNFVANVRDQEGAA